MILFLFTIICTKPPLFTLFQMQSLSQFPRIKLCQGNAKYTHWYEYIYICSNANVIFSFLDDVICQMWILKKKLSLELNIESNFSVTLFSSPNNAYSHCHSFYVYKKHTFLWETKTATELQHKMNENHEDTRLCCTQCEIIVVEN